MDKCRFYLAVFFFALLPQQICADLVFEAISKFEEELATTLAALDAPLIPSQDKMHEPIIGDYFLITEEGITKVIQLPITEEQVHTITLDSGVKIYFWQPKDTAC